MAEHIWVLSNGQHYRVAFTNIILLVFRDTELLLYVKNPINDNVETLPTTRKVKWRTTLESAPGFERVHRKHLLNFSYLWKVTNGRMAILTVTIPEQVYFSTRAIERLEGFRTGKKAD